MAAMRLALVHMRHKPSGGTERYLDRLARHLAERGHEVVIVCRSHAEPPHPAVRFHVLRPLAVGGAWRLWGFAAAVERHVARAGYELVVGLGKTWSQDVLRLGGGCQRTYLELAHAATLTPRERWLGGGALKHSLAVRIEERALAPGACARVITNSDLVRRDVLARYDLPEERVVTIHNGVDLERFHPRLRATRGAELRREFGFTPDELVVLFLGTGYARKGLDLALAACVPFFRAWPAARLVVAGFDSARPGYEARARELGLSGRTRFLGGRADPEALYAAADLYLLPTRYDPFANSTLEALASGLPVITSTHNGGGELLSARAQGAVVDVTRADAAEALAAELAHFADAARRRAAAAAARALAERNGEGVGFERAEALFGAVLAERTGASA